MGERVCCTHQIILFLLLSSDKMGPYSRICLPFPPVPWKNCIPFAEKGKCNKTHKILFFPFSSLARGQIRCLPFPPKKNFIDPSLSHGVHVPQLFFWPEKHSSPQKTYWQIKAVHFFSLPPFNLLHAFLSLFLFFLGNWCACFSFPFLLGTRKLTAAKEIAKVFAASNNAHNYIQTHTTYVQQKKSSNNNCTLSPLTPRTFFELNK